MNQEYYMGLDMGTGSLGWAITDTDYHILRRHGKALWGVRLFESALTAEERRSFRIARRRLDRRNWRIQILQELFSEEISKVDLGFFQRMKESKYYPEDKKDINGNVRNCHMHCLWIKITQTKSIIESIQQSII